MYASIQRRPVSWAYLMRWSGGISGAFLLLSWLGFVTVELFRPGFTLPTWTLAQACALAIVFAGYVVGWRRELAGGVLTLFGTAAFFAVNVLSTGTTPGLATAWFAAPGVCYLLAWSLAYRFGRVKSTRMARRRRQFEELFFARPR